MTRHEACNALLKGHTIRHRFFTEDEHIKLASDGSGRYEDEQGYIFTPSVFWADRREPAWQYGWELVTTNQNKSEANN